MSPVGGSPSTTPMKKFQTSLKRKFSARDRLKQMTGYSNDSFSSDDIPPVSASDGELNNRGGTSNNAKGKFVYCIV